MRVYLRSLAVLAGIVACAPESSSQQESHPGPLVAVDSAAMAKLVGWYHLEKLGPAIVTWGAQNVLTLMVVRDTMLWAPMIAVSADSFVVPQPSDRPPSAIRFSRDADGAVTGLRWTSTRGVHLATRASEGEYDPHPVAYKAPDGEHIAATLFVPRGRGPFPGAVIIHGSGTSTRDNSWYMTLADAMASKGIAVLFPDKRGSGASGGNWRTADLSLLAGDAIAGVGVLRKHPLVDSSAVGLVGISQGGHIAPMAAKESPQIAYVVNVSGAAVPFNDQLRHEVTQDVRRSKWPAFMHSAVRAVSLRVIRRREAEWWQRNGSIDPAGHWRELSIPGLIIYGADDESDNVPVARSVARLESLSRSNLTVRVFEESGHALYLKGTTRIRPDVLELLPRWIHEVLSQRSPRLEMIRSYVQAFNSGSPEPLARVLESMYARALLEGFGGARAAAWDRLELRRTYGPVSITHVDSDATPPIVWTKGTVSRGWIGHQLFFAEGSPSKVRRHSIWRARPVAYSRIALSPEQVADSMTGFLDEMSRAGLFSGSVTMSQRGDQVLDASWGLDGQPSARAVSRGTRFHIASVTKLFTVTALLQLAQEGIVSLNHSLGHWIPEYPEPYRSRVQVRHLLTHTSGIELDEIPAYLREIRTARTAGELLQAQIRHIAGHAPRFEPGTEYDYTSEGIDLLAVIIERATGRPWTEVVRARVLDAAGMNRTRFTVPLDSGMWALGRTSVSPDLQTTIPGSLRPALEVLTDVAKPSSGAWSTSEEMHRFMRALLEHRLLNPAWTDSLLTPKLVTGDLPKYGIHSWVGLGGQGEDLWGTRTVGHGGVVPGYSAAIEYLPESGWLLTVVSNTGEATAFLVFQRFLELVAGSLS